VGKYVRTVVVLILAGAVALFSYWLQNRASQPNFKVVLCPANATLPGGTPLPPGVPCPTTAPQVVTGTVPPTTVPPASDLIPTNKGDSSQGWAVLPGTLIAGDSDWDSGTMKVRNEQTTTQDADFDISIYQSVTLAGSTAPMTTFVDELQGNVNSVRPGAASIVYLDSTGLLETPASTPDATYTYTFSVGP